MIEDDYRDEDGTRNDSSEITWYDPQSGETMTDTELWSRIAAIVSDADALLALGHEDCFQERMSEAQNLGDRFSTPATDEQIERSFDVYR